MSLCDYCVHRDVCGTDDARAKIGKASPFLYTCDNFIDKSVLSVPKMKKGEWILKCEFPRRWECSCCHTSSYEHLDRCPKCEADMRGE